MTDRNPYLLHRNGPRRELSQEQINAQAAAVAAFHARQQRKRSNERLCALAVFCMTAALAVALFYSATN